MVRIFWSAAMYSVIVLGSNTKRQVKDLLTLKTTMIIEKTQVSFRVVGLIFLLIFSLKADQASVWNRFRGPHGSGVAVGCQPPVRVGKDYEAWRVSIPQGLSLIHI